MNGGFAPREIPLLVRGRSRFGNRIRVLLFSKAREVRCRALVPAKLVAGILPAPTEQARSPCHRAMHETLLVIVPNGVRGDAECGHGGVDERVRRLDGDAFRNGEPILLSLNKHKLWRF